METLCSILERFQTLVAGGLALGAATWTVHTLRRQIRQSRDLHDELIKRKFDAARAAMLLPISDLLTYAEESCKYAAHARAAFEGKNDFTDETPELPIEVIPLLRELIESAQPVDAEEIKGLISEIQDHHFELANLSTELSRAELDSGVKYFTLNKFDRAIYDAAYLCVRAASFREYTRGKEMLRRDQTEQRVSLMLALLGITQKDYPDVFRQRPAWATTPTDAGET